MTGNRSGKMIFLIFFGLIISLCLSSCQSTVTPKLKIGCLREAKTETGESKPDNTICGSGMITMPDIEVIDLPYSEESPENGFYPVIEQAADNGIVLLVGYLSQSELKQAAKTAEFFGIPLLLPVTVADRNDISNGFPVFRLVPSIQDTVNYLFTNILDSGTRQAVNNRIFQNAIVEDYSIDVGVLYEDSPFGESAAVETARTVLENGFRLTLYQKMDSSGEKSEENQLLSDFFAEEAREIDIFFIISGSPETGISTVSFPVLETIQENKPLMVYWYEQTDETAPVKTLDRTHAVMVRQAIDRLDCPPEIIASSDAGNLAAASIIESVFTEIIPSVQVQNSYSKLFKKVLKNEEISEKYRGMILEQIQLADNTAPCLGRIVFKSDGSTSNPELEIITGIDGFLRVTTKDEILDTLAAKIRMDQLSENLHMNQ